MSDKNIEVIKHIQATGKCPEDAIMATSVYSESGYQPKKAPIPPPPTKGSSAVHPTEKLEVKIDCSNTLFDPNEKDPVMRALNMVKEYCRVSLKDLQERLLEPQNRINQQRAYVDVIDFIEDHQNKCKTVFKKSEFVEPKQQDADHLTKEVEWFQKRMKEYKESFFKVCDIVEHSDCADIIKKLINEERRKY